MKKLIPALLFAALFLTFAACGDDKDEPVFPTTQQLESEHGQTNDTYLIWDIDMSEDSSSIYLYNAVFTIGGATSPAMTLRIDAPVTVDKSGKVYTFAGTGIVAHMLRGTTWMPMPGDAYLVNNLISTVNPGATTSPISFDCHGGHFEKEGKLK